MPVITCPQCPTQLKVPAGVSGNTKCPKCGTVFPVKTQPAFEVVDDPVPAPPLPPPPTKTANGSGEPGEGSPPRTEEPDFEIVEDAPKKPVIARPAKTLAQIDDDEEDEDDRPKKKPKKKKKKPRYEDDEDEYWQPRPVGRGALGKGGTGALLISISFWLNMATFGLLTLYAVVMWIGVVAMTSSSPSSRRSSGGIGASTEFEDIMQLIIVLPGLLGLCAWIVGAIGSAIAIAGPARSRGMAIATTVTSSVHLLFVGVLFVVLLDAINSAVARELGLGSPAWFVVATTLPVLDIFFPVVLMQPSMIGVYFLLACLTACFEIARLVLMLLTVKGLARAAGDHAVAEKTQFGLILALIIIGVVALVCLMASILLRGGGINPKVVLNLGMALIFLSFLAYTFMMLIPGMAAHQTQKACGRRA